MKNVLILIVLFCCIIPAASPAVTPLDTDVYSSLDELAGALGQHFSGTGTRGGEARPVRLALIPVRVERAELLSGLVQRLAGSGKFFVLDAATAETFLKEHKESGLGAISELKSAYSLDAVAAIRAYPSQRSLLVSVVFLSETPAVARPTIMALVDPREVESAKKEAPAAAPAEKATALPDIPVAARYFTSGDLDGDGIREYVFSDGVALSIFRLAGTGWTKVWSDRSEGQHYALDLGDANGNGRPELYVTEVRKNQAITAVYEALAGSFKKVSETPGFVRPVRYPGQGTVLIGQDFDRETFFTGKPRTFHWKNGALAAGDAFPLPKGIGLYDFIIAEFGEPSPLIVAIDFKNYLRVFSRDTQIWESQERYAGTETVAIEESKDVYNLRPKVTLKGRFFALDMDGDGREEVVLPRGISSLFGAVKESEFHVLGWTGARLEQEWAIKKVSGQVLDFQLAPRDKGGMELLALVQEKGGLVSKGQIRLISYRVE
jgi:hypothetical protein